MTFLVPLCAACEALANGTKRPRRLHVQPGQVRLCRCHYWRLLGGYVASADTFPCVSKTRAIEANMAAEAEKLAGEPDSIETGWVRTALEGLRLTLHLANEKRIKIIVNGGGLNPRGLAIKTHNMVRNMMPLCNSC